MVVFGFWWRVRRERRSAPAPSPPQAVLETEPAVASERVVPLGPGCFDSSWDLLRGLEVCEGPAEAWAVSDPPLEWR